MLIKTLIERLRTRRNSGCPRRKIRKTTQPEVLESRLLLTVAPELFAIGSSSTDEGSVYTLNLAASAAGADTISQWTIDWNDATAPEVVTGNPSSVTHVYADGTETHPVSATATDEDGTWTAIAVPAEGAITGDPLFGDNGVVQFDLADAVTEYFQAMDLQPDGRIVAAGNYQVDSRSSFVLARFLVDGSLDTSFGTADSDGIDGIVLLPNEQPANSVVVHPNGRIIVGAGYQLFGFDADGTADNSFGASASTNKSGSFFTQARDLEIDGQGRIVAAGYRSNYTNPATGERTTDMILTRFDADGLLDTTFATGDGDGRDGTAVIDIGSGNGIRVHDSLEAIALDDQDRIVVVGRGGSKLNYATLRFTDDGLLDPTFGAGPSYAWDTGDVIEDVDGLVLTSLRSINWVQTDVVIASDGRIFSGGRGTLIGLLPDGTLDPQFASAGVLWDAGSVYRVLIDDSDHIFTVGSSKITRIRPDGSRDVYFGPNGQYQPSETVGFTDALLDDQGRILAAGGFRPEVGNLTLGLQRFVPATLNVTVNNIAPSVVLNGPNSADEGETYSYAFTTSDPGDDTFALQSATAGPDATIYNVVFDSATGSGSFDVTFNDGPATTAVAVQVTDSDGALSADPAMTLPDLRFGDGGTAVVDIRDDGGGDVSNVVAVQPDGKVLVGGYSRGPSSFETAVVRFNIDGSVDTEFGDNGASLLSFSNAEEIHSLADGSILIRASQRLIRLRGDGSLDTTFGTQSGSSIIPWRSPGGAFTVILSDGSIMVGGILSSGTLPTNGGTTTDFDFAVARFHPDGTRNLDFGDNGVVTVDLGNSHEGPKGMFLDTTEAGDERLMMYGERRVYNADGPGSTTNTVVARLGIDGILDLTYGTGTGFWEGRPGFSVAAAAVGSDGKVVLVGPDSEPGTGRDFGALRLTADGSDLDIDFGGDGVVTVDMGGSFDYPRRVAIDDFGRVVIVGEANLSEGSRLAIARLNADGSVDPTFSDDGRDIGVLISARGLTVVDDMIVVAGQAEGGQFGVARYATGQISVAVASVAPEIDVDNEAVMLNEGQIATNAGTFRDAVSIVADIGTVVVDGAPGTWSWSHAADDDLDQDVTITATNNNGDATSVSFALTVNNVAPTPTVAGIPVSPAEGDTISLGSSFSDPGTLDTHTYAWSVTKNGTTYDFVTGATIDFTPDDNGTYEVTLTVTDDDGGIGAATETLEVSNVAPTVTLSGATAANEGQTHRYSFTASDPGADTFSALSIDAGPDASVSNQTFNPVTGTGGFDVSFHDGPNTTAVTVQLEDSDGAAGDVAAIDVVVANVAPTVAVDQAAVSVDEADTAINSGAFGDVGADIVTLTASVGTVTHNGAGTWSWSWDTSDGPDDSQTVTITATDSDGAATSVDFALTVNNVAPSVTIDTTAVVIDEGSSTSKAITTADVAADTVSLAASIGTITDNSGGSWTWNYDGTDDLATTVVTLNATDEDGGLTTASFELTVNNVAPVVYVSLSATAIEENGSTVLSGQIADPGAVDTYTLNLDWGDSLSPDDAQTFSLGSSTLTEVTDGINWDPDTRVFSLAHQYLDDNGSGDASNIYTIAVDVTDDDTGTGDTSTTVDVSNVLPVIETYDSSSSTLATRSDDGTVVIDGTFSDIGTLDTHSMVVDWGDESPLEPITELDQVADTFTASHDYARGGIYTVTVTLTDDDGQSVSQSTSAVITGVGVVDGTLFIIGTDGKDRVKLKLNEKKNELKVDAKLNQGGSDGGSDEARIKIKDTLPASSINRIVTHLFDGDDDYDGGSDGGSNGGSDGGADLAVRQFVFGGDGKDKISGGRGSDVLFGGAGKDDIKGGNGADILIGGDGKDKLKGGRGDDLLIGGELDVDWESVLDFSDLDRALTEWASGALADTMSILGNVLDDDDKDDLFGEKGVDTLIGGNGDKKKQ